MSRALLVQDRQRGLGDVDHAEQICLNLGAEILERHRLDRRAHSVARVVDHNVEPAELVDSQLDSGGGGHRIGHVQRRRAHLVAVLAHEVIKPLRAARGRYHLVSAGQHGLDELPPETTRAARDQPCLCHDHPFLPPHMPVTAIPAHEGHNPGFWSAARVITAPMRMGRARACPGSWTCSAPAA